MPRLLVLNAFAPHKHSGKNVPANESVTAKEKRLREERFNDVIRVKFKKLNVTYLLSPAAVLTTFKCFILQLTHS